MRINPDGTSSIALGLVHVACVRQTYADYDSLFQDSQTHDPVDLNKQTHCSRCCFPFVANDRVALQGVLA